MTVSSVDLLAYFILVCSSLVNLDGCVFLIQFIIFNGKGYNLLPLILDEMDLWMTP